MNELFHASLVDDVGGASLSCRIMNGDFLFLRENWHTYPKCFHQPLYQSAIARECQQFQHSLSNRLECHHFPFERSIFPYSRMFVWEENKKIQINSKLFEMVMDRLPIGDFVCGFFFDYIAIKMLRLEMAAQWILEKKMTLPYDRDLSEHYTVKWQRKKKLKERNKKCDLSHTDQHRFVLRHSQLCNCYYTISLSSKWVTISLFSMHLFLHQTSGDVWRNPNEFQLDVFYSSSDTLYT